MLYYIRRDTLSRFWIHEFSSTTKGRIDPQKWGFRNPVQMVKSREIYSSSGRKWPHTVKVIPGDLVMTAHEVIIKIFTVKKDDI